MIANAVVLVLLLAGCFFFLLGTVGILRMPDVLSRLHPATKCDTLGAGSVLLAMAIHAGNAGDAARLLVIGFFLFISSAACSHAIGRSVFRNNPDCVPDERTGSQRQGGNKK